MVFHKKTVFTIIIILVFAFVIAGGLFLYIKYKEPKSPAIEAIPKNAAFFIVSDQFEDVWNKLNLDNLFWKDISTIPEIKSIQEEWAYILKNLKGHNRFNKLPAKKRMVLSFHYSGDNHYELLYLQELESNFQKKSIDNFIRKIYANKGTFGKETFDGNTINSVLFERSKRKFYYSSVKSVFIGSFDLSLVESAINHLGQAESLSQDKSFIALKGTAGKKVDANIYVNYLYFTKFLSDFLEESQIPFIEFIGDLAGMSELDLILKPDELLLNGFTAGDNDDKQYLQIFRGLENRKVELTRILPSKTSAFIFHGVDSITNYYARYLTYLKTKDQYSDYEDKLSRLNKKHGIDASKLLCDAFDGEYAMALVAANASDKKERIYAVFHLEPEKGKTHIQNLVKKSRNQTGNPYSAVNYKDFIINRIEIPGLISTVWGNLFSGLNDSYYTIIENYCVFANSPSDLIDFINSYVNGKTLQRSSNYISFSDNVSEYASLYFYYSHANGETLVKDYMNEETASAFNNVSGNLKNFEALAIQYNSNDPLFYTNVYLRYNPERPEEKPLVKEAILDTTLIGKPFLIRDHRSNSQKILAFDAANSMYLIDENASIIWKAHVAEKIISDVFLIDYYQNGKFQYMFNTENYLYLVDLNGNMVGEYPIKLQTKATNGITVVDYDKSGNYRILVSGKDNKVYNYTKEGKIVDGWAVPKLKARATEAVQFLTLGNKDYIIVYDSIGNVYFFNRRGEIRINVKKTLDKSRNSLIYTDQEGKNFITTNTRGNIISISPEGKIGEDDKGKFSKDHQFIYQDFNGDQINDLIYLDQNKLKIMNPDGQLLLQYDFKTDIAAFIKAFRTGPDKSSIIGTFSINSGEIYLFNKEGLIEQNQLLKSKYPFIITSFYNNETYNIISCTGNSILIYPTQ